MGCNPKLPKDCKLVVFNPLWCLDEEFADSLARQFQRLSTYEASDTDWRVFEGRHYPDLEQAARARFLSTVSTIAQDPHVHMQGRSKEYDDDKIKPTPLAVKMTQILKAADQASRGDVVILSGDYKEEHDHWKHDTGCHVVSFSVQGCTKMLDHFDSELGQALWDIRIANRSNFGMAFNTFLKDMVDIRHVAVSYCIPSIGHKLHFNQELILPIPSNFDYTRSECWSCNWVAESDQLLRPVSGKVTLFTKVEDIDYLVKPKDVIIRHPPELTDRWLSWWPFSKRGHDTYDRNSTKEPTVLTYYNGEKFYVNNFPDVHGNTVMVQPEEYRHTSAGPANKKRARSERSQHLLFKHRIWTSNQTEATRFYPLGLFVLRALLALSILLLWEDWLSFVPSLSPRVAARDGDFIMDCI